MGRFRLVILGRVGRPILGRLAFSLTALSPVVLSLIALAPVRAAAEPRQVGPAPTRPPDSGYRAPIDGQPVVLRAFERPPTPYAAGHRGVDIAASVGSAVLAGAAGVVGFAGQVAGRGVVVVIHPDGVSTEYEPVIPAVHTGEAVAGGQVIATVTGMHPGCPAGGCLHWGARRNGEYFDPLTLLATLGPIRLLPWS